MLGTMQFGDYVFMDSPAVVSVKNLFRGLTSGEKCPQKIATCSGIIKGRAFSDTSEQAVGLRKLIGEVLPLVLPDGSSFKARIKSMHLEPCKANMIPYEIVFMEDLAY